MSASTRSSASESLTEADTTSHMILQHDNKLWFDDGNIVLVADNRAFCVHRSMLIRDSQVFKDLFELSQPSLEEELDGLPMVRLHDSPHELADLLHVIYGGVR